MKKFFDYLKTTSRLSLYNPIYIVICAVVTYYGWASGNNLFGMAVLMLLACVVLIVNEDIMPVIPCLLFAIFNTSNQNILNEEKTWPILIVLCILLVGSFISHLITYPIHFKNHKLTLPLVGVTIALFMGGIGYLKISQYLSGIIFILSLGPCLLIVYYLLRCYSNPPKGVDYKRYICQIMLIMGLLVAAQMITHFLRADKPIIELLRHDTIQIGWGNRNGIGALLTISAPCCFYLAFNDKRFAWAYYALGLFLYGCIFLTFCRSAMLTAVIALPALLVYSFTKGAHRSQLLTVICIYAITLCSFILIKTDKFIELLEHVSSLTMTSSGRRDLYSEALLCFLKNPMFGVGIGYVGSNFDMPDFCMYWYHNTILQIIASTGIVGVVAYGYFYIARGKIMFSNLKRFNIILSIAILSLEFQSMFDNTTFVPFPYMLIIIVLTTTLEYSNSTEKKTFMASINMTNDI